MKTLKSILVLIAILIASSCQKDGQIQPASNKEITISDCNRCQGGWDLTDTIP